MRRDSNRRTARFHLGSPAMHSLLLSPVTAEESRTAREIVTRLQQSTLFRDYQQAFETATGLPLVLRAPGAFQAPLDGSKHRNPLCAALAASNKACSACLQDQQRLEDLAQS